MTISTEELSNILFKHPTTICYGSEMPTKAAKYITQKQFDKFYENFNSAAYNPVGLPLHADQIRRLLTFNLVSLIVITPEVIPPLKEHASFQITEPHGSADVVHVGFARKLFIDHLDSPYIEKIRQHHKLFSQFLRLKDKMKTPNEDYNCIHRMLCSFREHKDREKIQEILKACGIDDGLGMINSWFEECSCLYLDNFNRALLPQFDLPLRRNLLPFLKCEEAVRVRSCSRRILPG